MAESCSPRRRSAPSLWCVLGAVALLLSSCQGKKVPLPPALDRDSFLEETSIDLPKGTEFLSSTTSTDNEGAVYTSLMLKMPKSAESLFSPTAAEVVWSNTSHQLMVNELSRLGVRLKDPKTPMRVRTLNSKTRGTGSVGFLSDGDLIFVECNFRLPAK